jgi:hypothetical protein
MEPIVLFGIQFTLSLVAYSLIAFWYVAPRLSALPRELALARYPNQPHSDLSHVDVPSASCQQTASNHASHGTMQHHVASVR